MSKARRPLLKWCWGQLQREFLITKDEAVKNSVLKRGQLSCMIIWAHCDINKSYFHLIPSRLFLKPFYYNWMTEICSQGLIFFQMRISSVFFYLGNVRKNSLYQNDCSTQNVLFIRLLQLLNCAAAFIELSWHWHCFTMKQMMYLCNSLWDFVRHWWTEKGSVIVGPSSIIWHICFGATNIILFLIYICFLLSQWQYQSSFV